MRRAPKGAYDSGILCSACDGDIGKRLDDVGASALLAALDDEKNVLRDSLGRLEAYRVPGVDKQALLRFFVSVLWRSAVSSHRSFENVRLGPYLELAREATWGAGPVAPAFDAVLQSWVNPDRSARTHFAITTPERVRLPVCNALFWKLHYGQGLALVKVGRGPLPTKIQQFGLQSDGPLLIRAAVPNATPDYQFGLKTAQEASNWKPPHKRSAQKT
jgi:hypothetical protein